ncbi:hypothetical protein B9479_000323 [Cryptococcus floricola]|uniref:Transmembrane protein n=1 Tax=Cryptococcus floricola TaxID=2591691 RepID=A0A5D3B8F4_9TREE|nr:hypothetical protein B9479_000323 [Cryptococcus floricola]
MISCTTTVISFLGLLAFATDRVSARKCLYTATGRKYACSGLSKGQRWGIAVGAVVGAILIIVLFALCCGGWSRRRSRGIVPPPQYDVERPPPPVKSEHQEEAATAPVFDTTPTYATSPIAADLTPAAPPVIASPAPVHHKKLYEGNTGGYAPPRRVGSPASASSGGRAR